MAGLVAGTAASLRLARVAAAQPLAVARLWDRELPRTSQRRAFTLDLGLDAHLVRGGNGSGKTYGGAQVAVACALGRHDPAVRAWAKANGFPLEKIPDRPGRVLASAGTFHQSRDTHRRCLDKYLPAGTVRQNWRGLGVATARLPGGGEIICMAASQGREAYQSFEFDVAWVDEEHIEAVWDEILERVGRCRWTDHTGWALYTMTPLQGLPWAERRFIADPWPGYSWAALYGSDNPHLDLRARARRYAKANANLVRARDRGEFVPMFGLVFPQFKRSVHVVPAFEVPRSWPQWGALDLGTDAPTAYVVGAIDRENDVLHIIAEHAENTLLVPARAAMYRTLHPHGAHPVCRLADLNTPDAIEVIQAYEEEGLRFEGANKSFDLGVEILRRRLGEEAPNGLRKIVVHDNCPTTIEEFEGYRWKPSDQYRGQAHKRTVGPDHCIDGVRYLACEVFVDPRAKAAAA